MTAYWHAAEAGCTERGFIVVPGVEKGQIGGCFRLELKNFDESCSGRAHVGCLPEHPQAPASASFGWMEEPGEGSPEIRG